MTLPTIPFTVVQFVKVIDAITLNYNPHEEKIKQLYIHLGYSLFCSNIIIRIHFAFMVYLKYKLSFRKQDCWYLSKKLEVGVSFLHLE